MADCVNLDEVAHYEPPHQDLRCLQIQLLSSLVLKELIFEVNFRLKLFVMVLIIIKIIIMIIIVKIISCKPSFVDEWYLYC